MRNTGSSISRLAAVKCQIDEVDKIGYDEFRSYVFELLTVLERTLKPVVEETEFQRFLAEASRIPEPRRRLAG